MILHDILLGQHVRILVDSGATHNIIDINLAILTAVVEHRINTTVLVGNGTEIACTSATFNVPLRMDTKTFHIDALLLDIGNDIDIILGTPWLTNIGIITWNFESIEMQFQRNDCTIKLSGIQNPHERRIVLALPAPVPIQPLPVQGGQQQQPHYNMLLTSTPWQPNALDRISSQSVVFD